MKNFCVGEFVYLIQKFELKQEPYLIIVHHFPLQLWKQNSVNLSYMKSAKMRDVYRKLLQFMAKGK